MNQLALFGGEPVRVKPFPAWPAFDEREERYALEVVRSGRWWRYTLGEAVDADAASPGEPSKVAEFQQRFAHVQGARYGIACASGTAALEVALRALGVGSGDEVIVPPYTFVATATAPLLIGATPVFCDIDLATFNMSPARFEEAITPRTRAVIPVHFAGLAADMDAILAIAKRHGIAVLEDAAHAHGGTWMGKGLGSIGAAGVFSFQASKNMTAGEGGLITTNDEDLAEICESLIWGGRHAGQPWYTHYRLGWNYRLTEFQGAILLAQLERLPEQTARRRANAAYLTSRLRDIPGISSLEAPDYATGHSHHLFVLRFEAKEFGLTREQFLEGLQAEGIPVLSGYAHSLFRNPMFLDPALGVDGEKYTALCPNSERACRETVWLEHRLLLGDQEDMEDIVRAVGKVHEARREFEAAANLTA
ncbi:MAG: DegT/DnrJ/EryC1/StrS family aminotransferase [Bryobacterales bacterium]|nr:DegT/DnrJ/EryC1/StrS family aminotransferase [Bryobacterales bacterium]